METRHTDVGRSDVDRIGPPPAPLRALDQLDTMAIAFLFDGRPLARTERWRTVAKVLSIGFIVRWCFAVLGGEVVAREQRIVVLRKAVGGLLVFEPVAFDEGFPVSCL